jgi:hypothetical protein
VRTQLAPICKAPIEAQLPAGLRVCAHVLQHRAGFGNEPIAEPLRIDPSREDELGGGGELTRSLDVRHGDAES